MTKKLYIAIDPNGQEHRRSTDRVYTHTVVFQASKDEAIKAATDKSWAPQEAKNFGYFVDIAEGRDPYPGKCWRSEPKWTTAEVEEERAQVEASNAKRVAKALLEIAGHTVESYVAAKLAERLARIEATDWTVWHNAGWCGRFDLAHKLACKYPFGRAAILDAVEKVKVAA